MTTPASAILPILPATPCYLNGEFSTLKDAKVSVLDGGFIFGDGVYEVVPAYDGRLFRFAQHMARLNRNHAVLQIANPLEPEQWRDTAHKSTADYAHWTGKVSGPPKDNLVLTGICYGLIEELCRAAGIGFELRRTSRTEVCTADELLLSSATKEIVPVTLLDGQPVGNV